MILPLIEVQEVLSVWERIGVGGEGLTVRWRVSVLGHPSALV